MWWYAERRNNKLYFLFLCLVFSVPIVLNLLLSHHVAAQSLTDSKGTTVGVTLCAPGSTITLTTPVSDSVVTNDTVQIAGEVVQASQVEVRIDDAFDSIIPLDVGQGSYSGSVQLPTGTHTIKVTAVNICAGPSGTATSVVTYSSPPQGPSTGSDVPTTAGGGVVIGGPQVGSSTGSLSPIDRTLQTLKDLATWLNIKIDDGTRTDLSAMSVSQAVVLTVGFILAIIGIAPPLLHFIVGIPGIAGMIPGAIASRRVRFLSIGTRVVGLLLILGSLFL